MVAFIRLCVQSIHNDQWYLNQFADGNVYNEMQHFKVQLKCKFYGI